MNLFLMKWCGSRNAAIAMVVTKTAACAAVCCFGLLACAQLALAVPLTLTGAVNHTVTGTENYDSIVRNPGSTVLFTAAGFGTTNQIVPATAPANINGMLPWAVVSDANAPGARS